MKASIVFQKNWDALQAGYRILENVGSSRSSKTWSFFQLIYLYGITNKSKKILVLRDVAVDCRDIVETEFKEWLADPNSRIKEFEDGEITADELDELLAKENLSQHLTENLTKHRFTFKATGSTIIFNGADSLGKVIGKANDIVWVNEPYKFPKEVMLQLLKRLNVCLLLDWNPNMGHYIEDFRSRPDCIHIHSTFLDNPFLNKAVKDEILGTKPLLNEYYRDLKLDVQQYFEWKEEDIETDLKAKGIEQKVINDILLCYRNEHYKTADKWHWETYGLGIKSERPNKILRFKPITLRDYNAIDAVKYYGVDWGQVDPFGVVEIKYYDGAIYINELNYKSENQIRANLSNIDRAQIKELDNSFGVEGGLVVWLFRKLNIDIKSDIVCDTNRPLKIRALRDAGFSGSVPAIKGAGSIVDGINILESLDVYYTETSVNLKYESDNYSRKVDKFGEVLEEPEDKDNHLIDPSRYVVTFMTIRKILRDKKATQK